MIEYAGYEEKYHDGVIACLMRNYDGLGALDPAAVSRWIEPLLSYSWQSGQPEDRPFLHGVVMLADGKVTGFVGCVYSYMEQGGKKLLVCKTTTVAVDKEFRRYDEEETPEGKKGGKRAVEMMYREILGSADVLTGDTPIPVMRRFLGNVAGFSDYETANYKFLTIPCFGKKLRYTFAEKPEDIPDAKVRAAFTDHEPYGIRLVRASGEHGECYVFYRLIRKKFRKKPLDKIRINFVSVLDVTDHGMFGKYAHEIIWAIQLRERAFLEADSRFFGDAGPSYALGRRTYETYRMVYSEAEKFDPKMIGGLYSELIMLGSPEES